ncbi:SPX-domain-containing protein [Hesseltinella vesiculosa]|uniref:SPX-domain-containing protein n=1 Tax=Hesseltinella vesiculosa TaxID=101127 RepID=A0A1X2GTS5_9FUNG|nr:SPX-domain-containing protein [Hesseltinella vesiculosa]
MKFGSQLKDTVYPEWQGAYLDYDGLKKKLRKAEKDNPFSEKDETEFVEMLDANLEKVYAFHQEKMEDIRARTDYWTEIIATQMPQEDAVEESGKIQESINDIADDINRLARYSRINYTGFLKIVKKHDRHTNYVLRPMFMVRLNQCPFWNENNDPLLLKLSQLFAQARQGGKTMSFKQPTPSVQEWASDRISGTLSPITASATPSSQLSRTIVKRYFVQPDNVLELKTYVLRHLPVLVYRDQTGKKENMDPPISTLYLDNTDLEAYSARVEAAPGSQIIRLRWYGSVQNNKSIAIEQRTLREENVANELKERFVIKDKYVSDFLQGGQAYVVKYAQKLRATPGKTEHDVDRFEALVKSVQKTIVDNKLQPVVRTFYKRTAFQIPGDNQVRMALDTDLCFIREDTNMFDQVKRRQQDEWHRTDVDTQFPFANIKQEDDVSRYPFATFEIKLDLAPGEQQPEWVTELEESGILEEAFDFNKFVHGVAVMFDTRVALLPYWLAQMGDDLNELPILPSHQPSVKKRDHSPVLDKHPQPHSDALAEATERTRLLPASQPTPTKPSTSYTTFPQLSESPPHTSDEDNLSWPQHCLKSLGGLFRHVFLGQTSAPPHHHQDISDIVLPPGVKVPKKVVTPLRVEPKVFFANERTYFAWMSFGTLLATFSVALFNAGDAVGKISGVVYTLVSISTLIYGVGLYYRRRELIRQRAAGPYDEIAGPTVICFSLLFAVGLNLYLKLTTRAPTLFYL